MRSKEHLWNLRSFWVAICVPVALACFVWGAMYGSGLPNLCWSSDCFNYAFELFKVPLALLALIFPAVALVASHHRSVQTAAQIDRTEKQTALTEAKNNFENYIKHKELFDKRLDALAKELKLNFIKKDELYNDVFHENSSLTFIPYVDNESDVFLFSIGKLFSYKRINYVHDYFVLINEMYEIEKKLKFKYEFNFFDRESIFNPKISKMHLKTMIDIFNSIINFSYISRPDWAKNIQIERFEVMYKEIDKLYKESYQDELYSAYGDQQFNTQDVNFDLEESEKSKLFFLFLKENYKKEFLDLPNINDVMSTVEGGS